MVRHTLIMFAYMYEMRYNTTCRNPDMNKMNE